MKFLIPQGIGDSIWALTKVQSIARKHGEKIIDVVTNTSGVDFRENRATEFILGFDFVNSVGVKKINIMAPPSTLPVDEKGCFRYIADGPGTVEGIDWTLMPNAPMEHGIRLEEWLPEYETNWDVMKHFQFTKSSLERGKLLRKAFGEFCVLFMGSMEGNLKDGHNRGPVWKPEDWLALGEFIQQHLGLAVVVVGAEYDKSYYQESIVGKGTSSSWIDLIGKTSISELYSIISLSRFVISYQSGVGIVAEYLGIPTAIFWRQKGDSISSMFYVSFEESMNGAWSPPNMLASEKHMALYYGRHDAKYVCEELVRRKW